jgi:hypothetical protein
MEQTVYNPHKGRLETINIDFTDENTTADIGHDHGRARALHRQYIVK